MRPIKLVQISVLVLFMSVLSNVDDVTCSPSLEPDWETRVQDIFELKKQAIAKQHASKLRLKSGELFLPTNVVPKSYHIKIRPILDSSDPEEIYTAPGSVTIVFECTSPTNSITLHAQTKEFIHIVEQSVRVSMLSIPICISH